MHSVALSPSIILATGDLVRGVAVAVVTVVVVVIAVVILAVVVLARRRARGPIAPPPAAGTTTTSTPDLALRAGTLLVALDDAVRAADEELGFAYAQFGADATRSYTAAVQSARGRLAEAFRLKQALDDHVPDSPRQQREWTLQIIALCEKADAELTEHEARFGELRAREVGAAATLAETRSAVEEARARLDPSRRALQELGKRYAAATFAGVAGHPDAAAQLLDQASERADAAAPAVSESGVSAVGATLQESAQFVHRAESLLDELERRARDLVGADHALDDLRESTHRDLAEARAQRDAAPDAATGRGVIAAIAGVESSLTPAQQLADPIAELDRIGAAVATLDTALASARNQAQRLEHARTAYAGALVSARSQIDTARDALGGGGSVDARTRLAEAERQLMLAEAESDPVSALDAVRRAATHARDADALARWRGGY